MKSLVLFSYQQPVEGPSLRWGVLQGSRDTVLDPLLPSTVYGPYRECDPQFKRTRTLDYVSTPRRGVKAFYRERERFRVRVPLLGSLINRLVR